MPNPREIAKQKNIPGNFGESEVEAAAKNSDLPAAPTYQITVTNPPEGPVQATGLKR